ncbi:MAG: M20 family peptidase [Balneolales bacterium]
MLKYIGLILAVFLLLLMAVVLIRTLLISKKNVIKVEPVIHDIIINSAAQRLSKALQFKSITVQDPSLQNNQEYEGFIEHLQVSYPGVHQTLKKERINDYSLLYRWQGADESKKPILLMAHYDVVPIEEGTEENWLHDPFSGTISNDGYVYGRGAMDDKVGLISIMEGIEYLISEGYTPGRTIYFAFGHDEETGGDRGASKIAKVLKDRNLSFSFVLDEGLPIVEDIFEGIQSPVALIGIAEKGYLSVELSVENEGGHSSMPPQNTSIGILSTAIDKLDNNPVPGKLSDLLALTFEAIAPKLPFTYRMAFSNLWLFSPFVKRQLDAIPATNAAMRTSTAPTIFESGIKDNIMPVFARAVINFRLHPRDDISSIMEYVRNTIDDEKVKINLLSGDLEPSRISSTEAFGYKALQHSINEVFTDIAVAPSVFLAGTDSRHYEDIADNTYRFRPIRATHEDSERIHGTNERISLSNFEEMIRFQIQMIRNSSNR